MQYMTMVCDIKNSKLIKDRARIQYKLIETLKIAKQNNYSIVYIQ